MARWSPQEMRFERAPLWSVPLQLAAADEAAQVQRQRRPGAHGVDAAPGMRAVLARGDVADGEHLGVRAALQRGPGEHEAPFVERQAAASQPVRRLGAGGDDGRVAGQPRAAAQHDGARLQRRAGVAQDGDVAHRQQALGARITPPAYPASGSGPGDERDAGAPRRRRRPAGAATASASSTPAAPPPTTTTSSTCRAPGQQPVDQQQEVLDRAHEEAVFMCPRQAAAVHRRAGVDRQHVVIRPCGHRPGARSARRCPARPRRPRPGHARRGRQRRQRDRALRRGVMPGHQSRHHAGIDLARVGRDQHHLGAGERFVRPAPAARARGRGHRRAGRALHAAQPGGRDTRHRGQPPLSHGARHGTSRPSAAAPAAVGALPVAGVRNLLASASVG